MCKRLGVTQGALSGWENEKYEPDINSLKKMSEIFDVSIDYLLGREGKKEKPTEVYELSENTKVLMDFVKTVPDDKVDLLLKVMKSIVEAE